MAVVDVEARRRLGEYVSRRRQSISLSVSAAARGAGLDRGTWTAVEAGTRQTEEYNYARIEKVLGWEQGSVAAILAGHEPKEISRASYLDQQIASGRTRQDAERTAPRVPDEEDLAEAIKVILDYPDLTDGEREEYVAIVQADWEREREEARRRLKEKTAIRLEERRRRSA